MPWPLQAQKYRIDKILTEAGKIEEFGAMTSEQKILVGIVCEDRLGQIVRLKEFSTIVSFDPEIRG